MILMIENMSQEVTSARVLFLKKQVGLWIHVNVKFQLYFHHVIGLQLAIIFLWSYGYLWYID